MNKIFKAFISLLVIFLMIIFISFPDRYLKMTLEGIKLWALVVLPSLLPFFFLTTLLTKLEILGKICKKTTKISKLLFRCNGIAFYVFFMSIISGYPVGSKIIYDLKKENLITTDEATRMSTFCSTSGPLFIVGAVGIGMFNNKYYGFVILLSHILSAIICGIIFRNFGKFTLDKKLLEVYNSSDNVLYESIYSSIISVLCVGGFISIFYVFVEIANDFYLLYPLEKLLYVALYPFTKNINYSKYFAFGLIECTKGCKFISNLSTTAFSCALSGSLISFGGLSVIAQSTIYLSRTKIKLRVFFISKILQSILTFYIIYFLLSL